MSGERILTDLEQQKFQRDRDLNEDVIAIVEHLHGRTIEDVNLILHQVGAYILKGSFVDIEGQGLAQMYAAFNDHFGGNLKPKRKFRRGRDD